MTTAERQRRHRDRRNAGEPVRTSLPDQRMPAEHVVLSYKLLSQNERAFRSMKTGDLPVRPSRHLTPTSIAVTTTRKGTCKMVGSPFHLAGTTNVCPRNGSIRVSQRYFGAFRCFSWVI